MDLNDLRAKVKIDTSGVGPAEAKLMAFGETVKRSLDSGPIDRAGQQIGQAFIRFGEDGELAAVRIRSSTARSRADLELLETRARTFASNLEGDFKRGTTAIIRLGEDGTAALGHVSEGGAQTSSVFSRVSATFGTLGNVAIPVLITGLVALAVAMSPIIVELSAFTVGLAAALTVMTVGLGLFAGLAAGAVVLAAATGNLGDASGKAQASQQELAAAGDKVAVAQQRVTNAQANLVAATKAHGAASLQAANAQASLTTATDALATAQGNLNALQQQGKGALAELEANAKKAADALGKQAAPAAALVLNFVNQLIAPIQNLASQTLAWFSANNRLGNTLGLLSGFADVFLGAMNRLGVVLGQFLDSFLARGPQFQSLFGSVMNFAVGVVQGLLANLLRLSDWFNTNLPTIGPGVQATFDGMGMAMQGVGAVLGAVLIPLFTLMAQHTDIVRAAAIGLIVILGAAVITVAAVALAVMAAAAAIQFLYNWVTNLGTGLASLVRWLGQTVASSGAARAAFDAATVAARIIAGALTGIGNAAQGAIGAVQRLVGALQAVPGAARAALNSIPGVAGATGALHAAGVPGFQHGGFALPGSLFRVGETGPELGYAVPGGGVMISPGGGAGLGARTINNYFYISGAGNPAGVAAAVDARLSELLTQT